MDAVKFIRERDRMCRFYHHAGGCYKCPATNCECSALECMVDDDNIVTVVEKWSATHPHKTRQSAFLEQWPKATMFNGVLKIDPCCIDNDFESPFCGECDCAQCRHKFWMQEVE